MAANRTSAAPVKTEDAAPTLIALKSGPKKEIERRELFSIDDKVYSVPVEVAPTVGLKYVHIARKQGPEAAADFMFEVLLGEEGYEALMDFDDLTEGDMENILEACSEIMVAASKAPKAKRAAGKR